jgi:hypothetical protein
MIRWVFALLLLANVALALWIYGHSGAGAPPDEAPRPALHAERLKLLAEPGVKLVPRPKPPAPAAAAAPEPVATTRACYRAGPYAELEAAVAAGRRLEERGVPAMRRDETRPTVTGYRVYLPPFPSRAAAEARRAELTRLGFRDHALIQQDGRYAISLGLYSIEANASAHVKRLRAKGINPVLAPIQQARTAYWLELAGDNLFEVLAGFDWGGAGVGLSEYSCPAPAEAAASP